MKKYLARRAAYAAVTLLGVSMSVFVILRVLPGDPLVAILGVEGHAQMRPADRVRIMADLGLSDPLPVQYARWLGYIGAGRLGKSFFRGDTVAELIAHRGPISAEIGILGKIWKNRRVQILDQAAIDRNSDQKRYNAFGH